MVQPYLNSAKWKILEAFNKGKLPKDINCSQVKKATIYAYYQEFKREVVWNPTWGDFL